jgi:hypothetical protein
MTVTSPQHARSHVSHHSKSSRPRLELLEDRSLPSNPFSWFGTNAVEMMGASDLLAPRLNEAVLSTVPQPMAPTPVSIHVATRPPFESAPPKDPPLQRRLEGAAAERLAIYPDLNSTGPISLLPSPPRRLPAPTDLSAGMITSQQVLLHWSYGGPPVDHFQVERAQPNSPFRTIGQVPYTAGVTDFSYTETPQRKTDDQFRVVAVDRLLHSPYSNIATVSVHPSAASPSLHSNLTGVSLPGQTHLGGTQHPLSPFLPTLGIGVERVT